MPCYHPISGWYANRVNESGKRSVVFNLRDGFKDKPVELPCGRCIGCRLERARQWAVRCMHEAKLYQENCFCTLTYDDEKVPPDGGLRPDDFVRFMKRLRKAYSGKRIRFFHCGEYGETTLRPHHHVLLFNHDFYDKRMCKRSGSGESLYSSGELERLWGFGKCWIGTVSWSSANYVARYSMKKVVGERAVDWYAGRKPEYLTMSRRPGIGTDWLMKYFAEVYSSDRVVSNGHEAKPPRFYDELYAKYFPSEFAGVVRRRIESAKSNPESNPTRFYALEAVKTAAIRNLRRTL